MTKFNSKTLSNLNRFSNAIANELVSGLKSGDIHAHGFEDTRTEVKKFLSMYKCLLSSRFGFNVSNILKTPKQLKFVLGSIATKLENANVA